MDGKLIWSKFNDNNISTETHQANEKKENLESPATGSYTHHVPVSWKLFEFQFIFTNLWEILKAGVLALTILIIVEMQNQLFEWSKLAGIDSVCTTVKMLEKLKCASFVIFIFSLSEMRILFLLPTVDMVTIRK